MKANELMIGDWVAHKGDPIQISSIGIACATGGDDDDFKMMHFLDLSPIPITPKLLEKNGFVQRTEGKVSRKSHQYIRDGIYISWWRQRLVVRHKQEAGRPSQYMNVDCHFIHELQHALRMAGIEKEVEL